MPKVDLPDPPPLVIPAAVSRAALYAASEAFRAVLHEHGIGADYIDTYIGMEEALDRTFTELERSLGTDEKEN